MLGTPGGLQRRKLALLFVDEAIGQKLKHR
jgi:hypothetical protein